MTTVLPEFGYNHLEPGQGGNPKPYRICGAQTRNETARMDICLNVAGYKTNHVGVGRCKFHGGRNGAGPESPRWKGGARAYIWRGRLEEHFNNVREATIADPLDLLPELEARRVLLAMAIEDLSRLEAGDDPAIDIAEGTQKAELRQSGTDGEAEFDNSHCIDEESTGSDATRAIPSTPTTNSNIGYPQHTPQPQDFIDSKKKVITESGYSPKGGFSKDSETVIQKSHDELVVEKVKLVSALADGVVNTVTQIIVSRNQTALTIAEVKYLQIRMVEAIERFIPDVETRAAFIEWLLAELPGGNETGRLEAGAGSAEVQAAREAG